jgi:hypothetical protein
MSGLFWEIDGSDYLVLMVFAFVRPACYGTCASSHWGLSDAA